MFCLDRYLSFITGFFTFLLASLLAFLMSACSTSPLGRERLLLVPQGQMDAMGAQAFQQMKTTTPTDQSSALNRYIHCVADPITQASRGDVQVENWEIIVFKDNTANAFALPGGKIGVHTGIFKVAKNDSQLATVLAHEVGHVIAQHSAERMSEQLATQGGLALVSAFLKGQTSDSKKNNLILGALGVGAQLGVILPFSRTQESEADLIGLKLMASPGFDPRESIKLWDNMISDSQGKSPPEFLSSHPASENRITNLQEHMPEAEALYQKAKASGLNPKCSPLPHLEH